MQKIDVICYIQISFFAINPFQWKEKHHLMPFLKARFIVYLQMTVLCICDKGCKSQLRVTGVTRLLSCFSARCRSSKSTSNSRYTTCYFTTSWKTKENFSSWYTIPPPPSNLIFNNLPVVGDGIHSNTANSYQKLSKSNGAACSSVLLNLPTWFFVLKRLHKTLQFAAA